MEDNNEREFTVAAVVDGTQHEVNVQTTETTDGVTIYNCRFNNNELVQVRKSEEQWELIWGDLKEEDVKSLGAAIEGSLLDK